MDRCSLFLPGAPWVAESFLLPGGIEGSGLEVPELSEIMRDCAGIINCGARGYGEGHVFF